MKRSEIYRKAARALETGKTISFGWSCWAICEAAGLRLYEPDESHPPEVVAYEKLFSPDTNDTSDRHCWGREWGPSERLDCRVLALCFMAAIAADEERSKR